ncbi:hypothetical protein [Pedobacter sp. NJ-S-72]
MEELYYHLIIKYYHQTITERDLTILQEWVASNPAHETEFREVILILDASKLYYIGHKSNPQNQLTEITNPYGQQSSFIKPYFSADYLGHRQSFGPSNQQP